MAKSVPRFRYSLKTLLVLMTIAALLTGYFKYYYGYHATPSEVELGSFHVLSGKPGNRHECECRVLLTTHWHDILEQRTRAKQKELQELVCSVIWSVPYADKCDPRLVLLRNQIKNKISKEVGSILGSKLVSQVELTEFSLQKKPNVLSQWALKQALVTQSAPSWLENSTSQSVAP